MAQQLIALFTDDTVWAGLAGTSCLCSSGVSLVLSSGPGDFTSNVAPSQGRQVGAGYCLGVQPEASVLKTWGFLGLPLSVATGLVLRMIVLRKTGRGNCQFFEAWAQRLSWHHLCHTLLVKWSQGLLRFKWRGHRPHCVMTRGVSSLISALKQLI